MRPITLRQTLLTLAQYLILDKSFVCGEPRSCFLLREVAQLLRIVLTIKINSAS